MTVDRATRVCYAAAIGTLCAFNYSLPLGLFLSVTVILLCNIFGAVLGED